MERKTSYNPLLYEINTRVWLNELRGRRKHHFALADVTDEALDELAGLHFDLVWLMGAWQTGTVGERLAREYVAANADLRGLLPNLTPADVAGSPYAVQAYRVSPTLGGPEALARLRQRLDKRGIGLLLDFVPNHTARDHDWVTSHPDFYVQGTEELLETEPHGYFAVDTRAGRRVLACGRDPYFPPWGDTAQFNHQHPGLRRALIETLLEIASQCDGVRCDMSMLVLRDVFARTWGERARPASGPEAEGEFWAEAIDAVRRRHPGFLFLGEAYWDLEPELQALGFDYTYDKALYDLLVNGEPAGIRQHLRGDFETQICSARFLENHDEPRAAAVFQADRHRAAALICYGAPGLRFFHEGQLEGRSVRVPVQLLRRPSEAPDKDTRRFYEQLLAELNHAVLRQGWWRQLEPRPAWDGNSTWEQFVAHSWYHRDYGSRLLVANFGPQQAQCYLLLEIPGLQGRHAVLRDLLRPISYHREGNSLRSPGLYLDMAPFEGHFFTVEHG